MPFRHSPPRRRQHFHRTHCPERTSGRVSCHQRRALAALLVFALQPVVLMCLPDHALQASGAISKVGRKPEGGTQGISPQVLRGGKKQARSLPLPGSHASSLYSELDFEKSARKKTPSPAS